MADEIPVERFVAHLTDTSLRGGGRINPVIRVSRNTQSWQHWHFWTTSNGNKLETVESQISFSANLNLSRCFELKPTYFSILLILKCNQYKNINFANLVYFRKTRMCFNRGEDCHQNKRRVSTFKLKIACDFQS